MFKDLSIVAFVAVVFVLHGAHCQLGLFFGDDLDAGSVEELVFPQDIDINGQGNKVFVKKQLSLEINFFGRKHGSIKIFRDGIATFGDNHVLSKCPTSRGSIDALAPFWSQTTVGSVTFSEVTRTNAGETINLSSKDTEVITKEIKQVFSVDVVDSSQIDSVVIVTWKNTFQELNNQLSKPKNTFQLAIVTAGETSYAFFIYRRLDLPRATPVVADPRHCRDRAAAGVFNGADQNKSFLLSLLFPPNLMSVISWFTNIPDYQILGRFVLKLSNDAPPRSFIVNSKCGGDNQDPICDIWAKLPQK